MASGACPSLLKALRRLNVLRVAMGRVKTASGEVVAHKAVLAMWETFFALRRSLEIAEPRASLCLRGGRRRQMTIAGLIVIISTGFLWAWKDYVVPDAASYIAYDLMQGNPPGVASTGIRGVEHDNGLSWRWIDGPSACLNVHMSMARKVIFRFAVLNPIPDQSLTLRLKGRQETLFKNLPSMVWGQVFRGEIILELDKGINTICFDSRDYNHRGTTFAPADPAPYAMAFTEFTITSVP